LHAYSPRKQQVEDEEEQQAKEAGAEGQWVDVEGAEGTVAHDVYFGWMLVMLLAEAGC
jgi:hypothetical protein